jgi:hypothetical protein
LRVSVGTAPIATGGLTRRVIALPNRIAIGIRITRLESCAHHRRLIPRKPRLSAHSELRGDVTSPGSLPSHPGLPRGRRWGCPNHATDAAHVSNPDHAKCVGPGVSHQCFIGLPGCGRLFFAPPRTLGCTPHPPTLYPGRWLLSWLAYRIPGVFGTYSV